MIKITWWVLTEHAKQQMVRRGIEEMVRTTVENPESIEELPSGKVVMQKRFVLGISGKTYLLRVFG